jgi:hypothetical protein
LQCNFFKTKCATTFFLPKNAAAFVEKNLSEALQGENKFSFFSTRQKSQ